MTAPVTVVATAVGAVFGAWVMIAVGWWPGLLWAPLIGYAVATLVIEAAHWAERREVNGWTDHHDDWRH